MISVAEAEALILRLTYPLNPDSDSESIDLLDAAGRILSQPVISPLDFPHWDNSAMDGYAVRFADVQGCDENHPATLHIIEEIPAGVAPKKTVQPGEAARILTGAMMPSGADTVVMQEKTRREGDRIHILTAPKPQQFVRHQAEFHSAGEPLLSAGTVLNPPEIAVLAAAQCAQVPVYRQLRVAVLSTGDELVLPTQPLQPGQIVDSNQYALAAAIAQTGAIPIDLGIVADDPLALRNAIATARTQADVIISSGGVSVGDYDYVEQILQDLGGTLHIRQVAVRPGKPLTVATFKEDGAASLYFGLPGNPVSALVTFWRFVQPALGKMAGRQDGYRPEMVWGRSSQHLQGDSKREAYLWGRVSLKGEGYTFHPAGGSHSSGNLINLAYANALAVLPAGQLSIQAGEPFQIMLL